jgi:hypothetical protein
MIEHADADVVAWLTDVVDPVPVTLGPPTAQPDRPSGVACHLLALIPEPPGRGPGRPPVRAVARYLVTSWAPAPADAHRALGQVLVAAIDRADVELGHSEPPAALWPALGVPAQPAVMLDVPVRWNRPQPTTPLVREPARVDWLGLRPLAGVVIGPTGVPIARAQLRVQDADAPTWTGPDGAFRLPAAPSAPTPMPLTVSARGVTRTVTVTPSTDLTIVFDPEE